MSLNWNPPKLPNRATAVYIWDPVSPDGFHYAALVHNGGKFRNGGDYPGRPWTRKALEEANLPDTFADEFKRTGSLERAFESTALAYFRENQKAITSKIWSWPNNTRRASGELAKRRRDIVDLGNLLDSQKLEFKR